MKTENQRRNPYYLLLKIVVLGGLAIVIGRSIYSEIRMGKEPLNYTTAVILKFERGAKVAPWFEYEFSANGQVYENHYSIANELRKENNSFLRSYIGRRFLVRYITDDPETNRLLLECSVPDSIVVTPPQGWEKRPFKCGEEIE